MCIATQGEQEAAQCDEADGVWLGNKCYGVDIDISIMVLSHGTECAALRYNSDCGYIRENVIESKKEIICKRAS